MLIYISGGVRSGKSSYAQQRAIALSDSPVYIATAKIWDEEFAERVKRHQLDRGPEWTTYEAYKRLYLLPLQHKVVVIDCITLWLTNFFMDTGQDLTRSLYSFKRELDQLLTLKCTILLISNELGMGLHADSAAGRQFADLQGLANQYAAARAQEAIFMVSGLPLVLKSD